MAGYLAAPAAPGRLVIAGDATALEVSRSAGDITLTPGTGQVVRRTSRTVLFDSVLAEPVESFCVFHAGSVAGSGSGIAQVAKWPNRNRGGQVYVRKITANLGTAQTTADAANYWRVKAADGFGGTAYLPLNEVGQRTYVLDQGIGSTIDKGLSAQSAVGFSYVWLNMLAVAFRFTVTQTQTLTGLRVDRGFTYANVDNGSNGATTVSARVGILDADGNFLGSGVAALPIGYSGADHGAVSVAFDRSVQVVPATTYYMSFDVLDGGAAPTGGAGTYGGMFMAYSNTQTSAASSGLNFDSGYVGAYIQSRPGGGTAGDTATRIAAVAQVTFPKLLTGATMPAGVSSNTSGGGDNVYSNGGTRPRNFSWHMLGSPSGLASLVGDLTFSIDAFGTPAAGADGADLNLSALLTVT